MYCNHPNVQVINKIQVWTLVISLCNNDLEGIYAYFCCKVSIVTFLKNKIFPDILCSA